MLRQTIPKIGLYTQFEIYHNRFINIVKCISILRVSSCLIAVRFSPIVNFWLFHNVDIKATICFSCFIQSSTYRLQFVVTISSCQCNCVKENIISLSLWITISVLYIYYTLSSKERESININQKIAPFLQDNKFKRCTHFYEMPDVFLFKKIINYIRHK